MAPGNEDTLTELRKRVSRPREPVPPVPQEVPVDERIFSRSVRSARRGDHLRPHLESTRDLHTLFKVALFWER